MSTLNEITLNEELVVFKRRVNNLFKYYAYLVSKLKNLKHNNSDNLQVKKIIKNTIVDLRYSSRFVRTKLHISDHSRFIALYRTANPHKWYISRRTSQNFETANQRLRRQKRVNFVQSWNVSDILQLHPAFDKFSSQLTWNARKNLIILPKHAEPFAVYSDDFVCDLFEQVLEQAADSAAESICKYLNEFQAKLLFVRNIFKL